MIIYSEYCQMLFEEFERRFDPARPRRSEKEKQEFSAEFSAQVAQINTGNQSKNQVIKTIFNCALNFLDCILKSNFYVCDKTALSFRLSVGFCVFYRELSADYAAAFPEALPYAVFYFYRRGAFGYHVRFTDIARGGWRSVVPSRGGNRLEMNDNYEYARDEAFRECYVLAHTQHLKNKDIYEGGAKLLTLLVPVRESGKLRPVLWHIQRSITRALLSLINYDQNKVLRDPQIVDYLGEREILEIGPDENMFDPMIEWIGAYAQKQQYRLGSGLISGKPGAGINHKEYGVTSFGIHQYLLKTLQELGIDPRREQFSVKIAGGPGGDVAGNAMKLLLAKENGDFIYPRLSIIAVTDGPAIAYDPEGLDRDELARLIHVSALDEFDPAKLRGEGAMLALSAPIELQWQTVLPAASAAGRRAAKQLAGARQLYASVSGQPHLLCRCLYPRRRQAFDYQRGQLGEVLSGGAGLLPGHYRGCQLLHHSRRAQKHTGARGLDHQGRLGQQMRRDHLLDGDTQRHHAG